MSIISQQLRLAEDYQPALTSFWQRGHFEHFIGCDNIRIEYAKFQHTQPHPCIVIVPGRVESYLKYQELCFDLYQQGFDIFIIDHRGQGLSQRILTDKNKGYVESFDCYRQDLDNFINNIICPHYPQAPYLLAHSMGGIIAADYLTIKPEAVKAAILSSPMIAINTGKIPYILAQPIIKFTDIINKILSNTPWYFLGQKAFKPTSFRKNTLMHSEKRYQVFSQLYQKTPNIQLGGVTIHWLIMAFKAEKQLFRHIKKITTPICILQAGTDVIVDNKKQQYFYKKIKQNSQLTCKQTKIVTIKNAYHELLFEDDQYREPALNQILDWFNQHK